MEQTDDDGSIMEDIGAYYEHLRLLKEYSKEVGTEFTLAELIDSHRQLRLAGRPLSV